MGTKSTHTVAVAREGVAVIEQETRMVHLYVPRPTRDTTDADLAARIEAMSRLRREWLDRGYDVKLIQ